MKSDSFSAPLEMEEPRLMKDCMAVAGASRLAMQPHVHAQDSRETLHFSVLDFLGCAVTGLNFRS